MAPAARSAVLEVYAGGARCGLIDYLDKGASLGADAPCLTMGEKDLSYGDVQRLTYRIARALQPGRRHAGRQSRDPVRQRSDRLCLRLRHLARRRRLVSDQSAQRGGREPLHPRRFRLHGLIFHSAYAPLVEQMRADLPKLSPSRLPRQPNALRAVARAWLDGVGDEPFEVATADDIAMIAGTGGTTGQPKGVMLSGRNLETMSALTLMSYPFEGRPVYLALAPLTHAAGVLCFPIMTLGGRIVIMPKADLGEFLDLIERRRVTHTFLPPTLIYMLLEHPKLAATDRSSLQCFWYGAAPISVARLEEALEKIGPVMAQLFGQTEAPMMISTMAAAGSLQSRRNDREPASGFGGAADAADAARSHGRRRPSAADRGARRDRRARIARDGGLLQEPRGDGGGLPVRLASHRRHRLSRRRTIFSTSSIAPRT